MRLCASISLVGSCRIPPLVMLPPAKVQNPSSKAVPDMVHDLMISASRQIELRVLAKFPVLSKRFHVRKRSPSSRRSGSELSMRFWEQGLTRLASTPSSQVSARVSSQP